MILNIGRKTPIFSLRIQWPMLKRAGDSSKLPALWTLSLIHKYLWANCTVIDANVIDQAGEVGAGFHALAATDVKSVA
jgi:hypothetical protein